MDWQQIKKAEEQKKLEEAKALVDATIGAVTSRLDNIEKHLGEIEAILASTLKLDRSRNKETPRELTQPGGSR